MFRYGIISKINRSICEMCCHILKYICINKIGIYKHIALEFLASCGAKKKTCTRFLKGCMHIEGLPRWH